MSSLYYLLFSNQDECLITFGTYNMFQLDGIFYID